MSDVPGFWDELEEVARRRSIEDWFYFLRAYLKEHPGDTVWPSRVPDWPDDEDEFDEWDEFFPEA